MVAGDSQNPEEIVKTSDNRKQSTAERIVPDKCQTSEENFNEKDKSKNKD